MDKKITSLETKLTAIPKEGELRSISIRGSKDASFVLQIVNNAGEFYNFETSAFTAGHVPQNNLRGTLLGSKFITFVRFPSVASAKTYNIIVTADHTTDTVVDRKGGVINTSLSQIVDTTLTYNYVTSNSTNYATFPTATTITGSPAKSKSTFTSVSNSVSNASSDAGGFGLRLIRQPVDTDLVYTKEQTVNGAITSSTKVVLNDITDIGVGMIISAVSSGSLTASTYVQSVDTATKTVVLSAANTFGHGITLTFEARGSKAIYSATSILLSRVKLSAIEPKDAVTKIGSTSGSSNTISLNGTYGIAGGNLVSYTGSGVDNSSANKVTSVSASASSGSIQVQAAQNLIAGTLLTFKGCSSKIDITASFIVKNIGSIDRTISLHIDNFITPGAAS